MRNRPDLHLRNIKVSLTQLNSYLFGIFFGEKLTKSLFMSPESVCWKANPPGHFIQGYRGAVLGSDYGSRISLQKESSRIKGVPGSSQAQSDLGKQLEGDNP